MATKFRQKLHKFQFLARNLETLNMLLNSNMLPEFTTEPRELP